MEEFWSGSPFDSSAASTPGRAHERHDWKYWVHVCWVRDSVIGDPLVVGTTDLSAGGVGLICPNMIHPGAIGLVMFVGANQQLKLRYIEVRHCRYLVGSMSHLVGARWVAEPPGMPEVRAEMTAEGPRIIVGQPRKERDARMRRRAATIMSDSSRHPHAEDHE